MSPTSRSAAKGKILTASKLSDRLKALLDAEERQYEVEFMQNLETPEQVREKMAQRLAELKDKRESERMGEVNRRLEQRFKDSKQCLVVTVSN